MSDVFPRILVSIKTKHVSIDVLYSPFTETGSVRLGRLAEDDGESGVFPAPAPPAAVAAAPRPVYEGPVPTAPQRAFQPGSTPEHLMHRFMVSRRIMGVRDGMM